MAETQWVVRHDGTAHEILTTDGEWGEMADAARFATNRRGDEGAVPGGDNRHADFRPPGRRHLKRHDNAGWRTRASGDARLGAGDGG